MKKIFAVLLALIIVAAGCVLTIAATDFSAEDPLISKSYLENDFFARVTEYIESKLSSFTPATAPSSGVSYEVITLTQGQTLVGKEGSIEIILRPGGSATVYSEIPSNGLADLTSGTELLSGAAVPVNACCLVPRSDGRGIVCTSAKAYVMVRGLYEIK